MKPKQTNKQIYSQIDAYIHTNIHRRMRKELFEIELFDQLIVCKRMTDV